MNNVVHIQTAVCEKVNKVSSGNRLVSVSLSAGRNLKLTEITLFVYQLQTFGMSSSRYIGF